MIQISILTTTHTCSVRRSIVASILHLTLGMPHHLRKVSTSQSALIGSKRDKSSRVFVASCGHSCPAKTKSMFGSGACFTQSVLTKEYSGRATITTKYIRILIATCIIARSHDAENSSSRCLHYDRSLGIEILNWYHTGMFQPAFAVMKVWWCYLVATI